MLERAVTAMEMIVDIQGFRDSAGNFTAKEVAVVAVNETFVGHWILRPPHTFEELSEKSRKQNNWLTQNYHGIEWYDGETDPTIFHHHLRELARQAHTIYTRGNEKARYLRRLLSRNIYNLEDVSPPFKALPPSEHTECCTFHALRKYKSFQCALRNAYKLKRWLVALDQSDDDDDEDVDENETDDDFYLENPDYHESSSKQTPEVEEEEEEEQNNRVSLSTVNDNPTCTNTLKSGYIKTFIPEVNIKILK